MIETNRMEFSLFWERLNNNAPQGYTPWTFPVVEHGKAPATKISWKADAARLTRVQADERLSMGGNVGISGRKNDRLILVDIDDPAIESELKPTMKIRSRSRLGTHAFYWAHPDDDILPTNIPTEQGEVRSSDQYVVAPGSYVPCTEQELNDKVSAGTITEEQRNRVLNDPERGLYTLDNDKEIATVTFDELPEVFKETYRAGKEQRKKSEKKTEDFEFQEIQAEGERSALYDVSVSDIAPSGLSEREPHPLHDSGTGMNWLVDGELGHCWRHLVSLNAIQYLCVEAGHLTCLQAGTPHHNSDGGPSQATDNEAIWIAWKEAKKHGIIPKDDPAPIRALKHISQKHDLCDERHIARDKKLPRHAYYRAVELIEEEY